jgi:hypothetical protein
MAHFALLNDDNIVLQVIVINNEDITLNGIEIEEEGIKLCNSLLEGKWVQTSYNSKFRKNYAGIGYKYDQSRDAFIPPQPFPSWILEEETCLWTAPVKMPEDGIYGWSEETLSWIEVN